jgi:hypothetical protein
MNYFRGQRPSTSAETKAKREYRETHPVCEACGRQKTKDAAHIVSEKTGGPAEEWNLLGLCFACHEGTFHYVGWKKFCEIFPHLAGKIVAARIRCGRKTN